MPATALNVIALISGGKDSLFSLLHCIQNGHQIIALANLYPPPTLPSNGSTHSPEMEEEDLNSFMYQTVGHTMIPLYAEALDLPLYRRSISGRAVQAGRNYAFAKHGNPDETEDLVPLLQEIKQKHPEVNALSTGAILSTYQRTRIESVAVRLGLTPLAYLWQYPALPPPVQRADSITGLLDDMEAEGCDARLIKIASAGIRETLLGSRVSDPWVQSRLVAGMSRFVEGDGLSLRGAILGEGGEYETLAVNGPPRVWKKRIEIDSTHNGIIEDEGGATRLIFGKTTLVDQSYEPMEEDSPMIRVPVMLDDKFSLLEGMLSQEQKPIKARSEAENLNLWTCPKLYQNIPSRTGMSANNLTDPDLSAEVTEQTVAIINQLDYLSKAMSDSTNLVTRVISTTILLRYMSDFAAMNTIYGARFNAINPPARVTICCGDSLPEGVLVSMSFALSTVDLARVNGLHVQSVSYWAPANIGPYSQAISVPIVSSDECSPEIVHVAGQIPLVPSSMTLSQTDFLGQAVLSLQHLWRIGQCVGVDWWTHGIAYLADAEPDEIQRRAKVAWEVWRGANTPASCQDGEGDSGEALSEDADAHGLDAWDLKYNHQISHHHSLPQPSKRLLNAHLHTLPNHSVLKSGAAGSFPSTSPQQAATRTTTTENPPFLAAHIDSLPRSAPIEWHSLGLAHLPTSPASQPAVTITTETEPGEEGISTSISTCHLDLHQTRTRSNSETGAASDEFQTGHPQTEPETKTKTPTIKPATDLPALTFFSLQILAAPSTPPASLAAALRSALAQSRIRSTTRGSGAHDFNVRHTTYNDDMAATTPTTTHNLNHTDHGPSPFPFPPSPSLSSPSPPSPSLTHLTLFPASAEAYEALQVLGLPGGGTVIPCRSLWGEGGRRVQVAVFGRWDMRGA